MPTVSHAVLGSRRRVALTVLAPLISVASLLTLGLYLHTWLVSSATSWAGHEVSADLSVYVAPSQLPEAAQRLQDVDSITRVERAQDVDALVTGASTVGATAGPSRGDEVVVTGRLPREDGEAAVNQNLSRQA